MEKIRGGFKRGCWGMPAIPLLKSRGYEAPEACAAVGHCVHMPPCFNMPPLKFLPQLKKAVRGGQMGQTPRHLR